MALLHARKSAARPPLRAMLVAACHVDPVHRLICAVAGDSYSTRFNLIPAAQAVLSMAAEIEPEPAEVLRWYRTTRIEHMGQQTAAQLVASGRAGDLITFLQAIRDEPSG